MFDPGVGAARQRAHEILDEFGLEYGAQADLIDLAFARNLIVVEKPIRGAEGRLVRTGDRAMATINENIRYDGKRSFVVAHEFGHYELHKDTPLFVCDENDFLDWHRRRPEETEANQFAAELLMPRDWFKAQTNATEISVNELERLAHLCGVSLTAAAFRCVELDVTPCAIAFCQDNEIQWSQVSPSFPYQYMRGSGTPDGYSGAGEFFSGGSTSEEPLETPADAWFRDYDLSSEEEVMEQCLTMSRLNATLSLISQV
jgi:Zn-dependent peptidase ImmA (M78 family)